MDAQGDARKDAQKDPLSDVLRLVGLTGGVFMDADFTAPWSVAGKVSPELCRPFMAPPDHVVAFHYVVEGAFWLTFEDGVTHQVRAGELVMMPHNQLHYFGSAPGARGVRVGDLIDKTAERPKLVKLVHGGGGERTRMVCGFLGGNGQLHPLLTSLPRVMTIELATLPSGDWMKITFVHATQTLAEGDAGAGTMVSRIAELLFAEAVRRYLSSLPPQETGWLAALRDPAIGRAISLMHARPAEAWTAEALAQEVNLSRSAFADRFSSLIGDPPMTYLLNWRMNLAKQQLRGSSRSIAQIAFDVGYNSEAAFTRAFSRQVGSPPAAWRKEAQQT
jgi:AraC-like DNA-binding protein